VTALLTLDEAADRLNVSRRTVERLIHDGLLRPTRIGTRTTRSGLVGHGRTLIREYELELYGLYRDR
jgi:excisionase family DNA binding protein